VLLKSKEMNPDRLDPCRINDFTRVPVVDVTTRQNDAQIRFLTTDRQTADITKT